MNDTSMNEGRDQQRRKRSRTSQRANANGRSAVQGGSASAAAEPNQKLKTALGPRLQRAVTPLASQPTELQDLLVPLLKGMLTSVGHINDKRESLSHFNKPMTDPKSKQPLKQLSKPDQDLPFIASSLRGKNPLTLTDAFKDDTELKRLVDAADADWEQYAKIKMAEHDLKIKQRELKLRTEQLQQQFFHFAVTWADGLVITNEFKHGLPADNELSEEKLQHKLVFDALLGCHEDLMVVAAPLLGYEDGVALCTDFKKRYNYDDGVTNTHASEGDKNFLKASAEMLARNLFVATMGNWMKEMETDQVRGVNAALRAKLRPKLKEKATADVASALNSAGPSSMEKQLMDKVLKASRNEAKKTYQTIVKSARKKSLGDAELQESTPIKNGQKSRKKRNKQQQQQKSQEQKQQQPTPIRKKGRQVRFSSTSPSRASSRTASQGNQDGAKRGKQKRGAGRR